MPDRETPKPETPVTDEWTKDVCLIGQGSLCCRYLTMSGGRGWSCEKLNAHGRAMIDARVDAGLFTARGDNCAGRRSR